MGQLVFIDEEELSELEGDGFYKKEYFELQKKLSVLREMMYPNVEIWLDVGREMDVNEVFIERAIEDGKKYNYKWKKGLLK